MGDPVTVVTHGCRLNAAESGEIARLARASGANGLVVHNGCAVTGEAVASLRRAVRRSAREHPGARIVVTGCAAHTDAEALAALPEVDAVIGNAEKLDAAAWRALPPLGASGSAKLRVSEPSARRPVHAREGRARAFLGVQNGCDHACTFCIIPKGRGATRSVPLDDAVEAVRRLAGEGVPEVVLTGVDLTSWGADLASRLPLGALVQAILEGVPDLPRLRLSSIDGAEIDGALLDALGEPRLMPQLHLSLQHGHDLILKRMRRRHSREDAVRLCEDARARRPDIALGADMIAGFPTETDAHHEASVSLVEACGLSRLHVFPFSPRAGTPAARMPFVDTATIRARAAELREASRAVALRHLAGRVGSTDEVVVHHGHDRKGRPTGLCRDGSRAVLAGEAAPGELVPSCIVGLDGTDLVAERVPVHTFASSRG